MMSFDWISVIRYFHLLEEVGGPLGNVLSNLYQSML